MTGGPGSRLPPVSPRLLEASLRLPEASGDPGREVEGLLMVGAKAVLPESPSDCTDRLEPLRACLGRGSTALSHASWRLLVSSSAFGKKNSCIAGKREG